MADIRVNVGSPRRSHEPGVTVGMNVNVFGLQKLDQSVTGAAMVPVAVRAMQPAYQQAYNDWAVMTGASRDSLEVAVTEVNPRSCRIALQAGGPKLMEDPRNVKGIDYAPFLEFNGSPSGSQPPGVLLRAVAENDPQMRQQIHSGVAELLRRIVNEQ